MTKTELRNIYKDRRLALSPQEKSRFTDLILINFQKIDFPPLRCVHTYLAAGDKNEIDTRQIRGYLAFRNPGLQVCVPKIDLATGRMKNIIYEEDMAIKVNKFGIEEPLHGEEIDAAEIDMVLTPLLAFDRQGNRVGFGKGFYDKFFQQCRSDVIRAGLSFFEAEEIITDTHSFDMPLSCCITPKDNYFF